MAEYIDREAAIRGFTYLARENFSLSKGYQLYLDGLKDADKHVRSIPAADVRKVNHGKWIFDRELTTHDGWTYRQHKCSECGRFTVEADNFCPKCGADMR